jgi:hypothetical protein
VKHVVGSLLLGAGLAGAASAATIANVTSTSLPGLSTSSIGPVGATPSPNNDNTPVSSPNVLPASIFFNAMGTAEYEFGVSNSGGTTEYTFTQAITNNSGPAWSGFRFELGYGTGAAFASAGSGVSFDVPSRDPSPLSSRFITLDHQAAQLDWSGAAVPSAGQVVFSFAVDVPDGLAALHPLALDRFTLRATPLAAVPEPPALLLMCGGLALMGWRCRR